MNNQPKCPPASRGTIETQGAQIGAETTIMRRRAVSVPGDGEQDRKGSALRWKGREHALEPVDERLFASKSGVSVGLLEGEPTMISVNDFILIGAQPGVRL